MFHIILEEGFEELGDLALIKVNGGACTGYSGGSYTSSGGGGGGGGDTPSNSGTFTAVVSNPGSCTSSGGGGGGGGGDTPTNSGTCSSLGVPGGTVNSGTCTYISVNVNNVDDNFDGELYKKDNIYLTGEEIAFILANPLDAIKINENATIAKDLFGEGGTISDAMRHAYWSALNAKDVGLEHAVEYGYAHEDFAANPPQDASMDIHNNKVGWEIFANNPTASDRQLLDLVEKAADSGQLIHYQ